MIRIRIDEQQSSSLEPLQQQQCSGSETVPCLQHSAPKKAKLLQAFIYCKNYGVIMHYIIVNHSFILLLLYIYIYYLLINANDIMMNIVYAHVFTLMLADAQLC